MDRTGIKRQTARAKAAGRSDHQIVWTFVVLVASIAAALIQIRSPRAAQLQTLHRAPAATAPSVDLNFSPPTTTSAKTLVR